MSCQFTPLARQVLSGVVQNRVTRGAWQSLIDASRTYDGFEAAVNFGADQLDKMLKRSGLPGSSARADTHTLI